MFDFDASTAKFKIYQNKLMTKAPVLSGKNNADPNCTCLVKNDISSVDVISSAEKISVTAENLMVDMLCVNEMKNIYDNSSEWPCLVWQGRKFYNDAKPMTNLSPTRLKSPR